MEIQDNEYKNLDPNYEVSPERKRELLKRLERNIRKGGIAHYQVLKLGKNDDEINFLYNLLQEKGIEIRGKNGVVSEEDWNCLHIPNMGKSFIPKVLDDEEQRQLFIELNNFSDEDKANNIPEYLRVRDKLIERNMKLAKWVTGWESIAKIKLSSEDKVQMAYLGLISAVDKYNPSKGFRFSTYATKAIYRRILREVSKEREIKQANDVAEQLVMIQEIKDQLLISLGREAKEYEIADILEIPLKRVHELEVLRRLKESESWEQIENNEMNIETIFEQLLDGDKGTQFDNEYILDGVYSDRDEVFPVGFRKKDMVHDSVITKMLKEDLNDIISTLEKKEQEVLIKRFGLNGKRARSLADIGRDYNVGPESIRILEEKALRKLKAPQTIKKIMPYREEINR